MSLLQFNVTLPAATSTKQDVAFRPKLEFMDMVEIGDGRWCVRTLRLPVRPPAVCRNVYSMDGPVGFLRFGEGTLASYGPGSSRIVQFQWNLKVLKPEE